MGPRHEPAESFFWSGGSGEGQGGVLGVRASGPPNSSIVPANSSTRGRGLLGAGSPPPDPYACRHPMRDRLVITLRELAAPRSVSVRSNASRTSFTSSELFNAGLQARLDQQGALDYRQVRTKRWGDPMATHGENRRPSPGNSDGRPWGAAQAAQHPVDRIDERAKLMPLTRRVGIAGGPRPLRQRRGRVAGHHPRGSRGGPHAHHRGAGAQLPCCGPRDPPLTPDIIDVRKSDRVTGQHRIPSTLAVSPSISAP